MGITCDTAQRIEGYITVCVRHSCRKRGGGEDLPMSSVWADTDHGSSSTIVTRLLRGWHLL